MAQALGYDIVEVSRGRVVAAAEPQARHRNPAGTVSFLDQFSFQCGYCTPGFVNAATVLIERLKHAPVAREQVEATVATALEKHICRCTGYVRYYQAVSDVILATPGLTQERA